ncbi:MAG TPA: hypothetical protein VEJ67_11440 [Candidatus Cybelea sp.]|nr:hypothetical protein [Candidatus Cybelea sp.]
MRRDFGIRFAHHFRAVADGMGLLETKEFLGRDPGDERQFQAMVALLQKNPNAFLTAPDANPPKPQSFDDLFAGRGEWEESPVEQGRRDC